MKLFARLIHGFGLLVAGFGLSVGFPSLGRFAFDQGFIPRLQFGFLGFCKRPCVEGLTHAVAGGLIGIPTVDAPNGGFHLRVDVGRMCVNSGLFAVYLGLAKYVPSFSIHAPIVLQIKHTAARVGPQYQVQEVFI